ncbi:MAG: heavy-metal-associated domain-containing protein [Thiobacillaceae bacterium]|nr:heavy-metal-associated domain-containing protein [Thiobacillaceae bacterium]
MERIVIGIGGMSCQGCVKSVTTALMALPGVAQVDVSLAAGQASVACDPRLVSPAQLRNAIEAAGFDAPASP